jgi:hypothetical protein
MRRVVTGMTSILRAQAGTALSPEWDRGFDEAFADLVTSDPDLVRDEFDALIGANWSEPPEPPAPPAPPAGRPEPPRSPDDSGQITPAGTTGPARANPDATQRSPP